MDILRIAALGTAGVLLGITVKGAKPEFALLVTVGAGLCILAGTVGKMQYLLGMLLNCKQLFDVLKQRGNIGKNPEQHKHKTGKACKKCLFFPAAVF